MAAASADESCLSESVAGVAGKRGKVSIDDAWRARSGNSNCHAPPIKGCQAGLIRVFLELAPQAIKLSRHYCMAFCLVEYDR